MLYGIFAGIFWALETVMLGKAMTMTHFVSSEEAVFLAPFISTFLHDTFSAVWACCINTAKGNLKKVVRIAGTKSGRLVMLAALIGGPVGMTGYVLAIHYMGSSIGAVASAVFPAVGAILAYIFLKEKMQWYRWLFLLATLSGVYGLSYSPDINVENFMLGIVGAVMCSLGWGTEAVILAKSLNDPEVKGPFALQIRQTTSALIYGAVLLPLLKGWHFTAHLFTQNTGFLIPAIMLAALFATVSYLCYYRAITSIGAAKSMALNVSYAAWAIVFTVIITRDTSTLTPLTVTCAAVVLISSILSATDFRELFSKSVKKQESQEKALDC